MTPTPSKPNDKLPEKLEVSNQFLKHGEFYVAEAFSQEKGGRQCFGPNLASELAHRWNTHEELSAMVKRLAVRTDHSADKAYQSCPVCFVDSGVGHSSNCAVGQLLARLEKGTK